ncbi:hypothetical protein CTI12_AA306170 [Artemisia annua]|uniref:Hydroxyproline-rich glycoprotein family protein n=1 Tax=Artemisia annua TaxID=35608 RepID=A0A2U1N5W5_ARTAN|nr:hypothetical protein CTI12_AA306170 [Artemisia annua]
MASTKVLILCILVVALTHSSNLEARRLLNIPGLPSTGDSSFPMPTLQTPSFPTFPPFGSSPSMGTGSMFPFPTTMPTTPSVPSFPGIFTPPITTPTNP